MPTLMNNYTHDHTPEDHVDNLRTFFNNVEGEGEGEGEEGVVKM